MFETQQIQTNENLTSQNTTINTTINQKFRVNSLIGLFKTSKYIKMCL